MKQLIQSSLVLSILGFCLMSPVTAQASASPQTLSNLNTAFQGESNAANRYAKFAEKAVTEGYPQVGKLFRAAAVAEGIHRDSHQQTIVKLGGTAATFHLEAVVPGTTADNLKAAITGESYERDTMYPGFLATAKAEDCRPAMRTLNFAFQTEKSHAKLYQDALDSLGKNSVVEYYVCQECGETLTALPDKKCPVCRNGRDQFTRIQ